MRIPQFLPYHLWWVTWVQRFAILTDVILLWFLWPAVLASRSEIKWPPLWRRPLLTLTSLVPVGVALTAATFPGEGPDQWIGKRESLFSNTLVLQSFDALEAAKIDDPKKLDSVKHTLVLRGRHLERAFFFGADLRKADLTGAQLQGAGLSTRSFRAQGSFLRSFRARGSCGRSFRARRSTARSFRARGSKARSSRPRHSTRRSF